MRQLRLIWAQPKRSSRRWTLASLQRINLSPFTMLPGSQPCRSLMGVTIIMSVEGREKIRHRQKASSWLILLKCTQFNRKMARIMWTWIWIMSLWWRQVPLSDWTVQLLIYCYNGHAPSYYPCRALPNCWAEVELSRMTEHTCVDIYRPQHNRTYKW